MPVPHAVLALLARQDGLITCDQAQRLGVPLRTLRGWASEQGWERVAPQVFLAGGHPFTEAARVRAAGLWAGSPSTVSGTAAAWWHGMLPRPPDDVRVTVPHRRGLRARLGVTVRRRDLADADRVGLRGAVAHREAAHRAGDGSGGAARLRVPRPGAAATRAVRPRPPPLLPQPRGARVRAGGSVTGGRRRPGRLCGRTAGHRAPARRRDHGMAARPPVRAVDDRYRLPRFHARRRGLVGRDKHVGTMDLERFRADRHKGNALVRARWDLLRFTWHDLTNRPDYVLGEIRAALDAHARTA